MFKFFKKNKKAVNNNMNDISNPIVKVVYSNALVENIYAACTCCYCNIKQDLSYEEKLEYIERRVKAGHGSVLEHGRIILKVRIPDDRKSETDLLDVLSSKASMYFTVDNDCCIHSIYISSSVRGFKYFVENCSFAKIGYDKNEVEMKLFKTIVEFLPSIFFADTYEELFKGRILDVYDFTMSRCGQLMPRSNIAKGSGIAYELLSVDRRDLEDMEYDKCIDIGFDINSLAQVKKETIISLPSSIQYEMPVTVVFKNMSRTATHQLVRHRNAITQESQRYVDYSNASFTVPSSVDSSAVYKTTLFGEVTIEQLVEKLMSIYPELVNQKMKKEDARSFLPSNVNCGKLYMTFTLGSLLKFLELRTDPHAQAEIRSYAKLVKTFVDNHIVIVD